MKLRTLGWVTFAGVAGGLAINLVEGLVNHTTIDLTTLAVGSLCGLIYAFSFYFCCGAPWIYIGPVVRQYPTTIRTPIVALVGAVGASLAITIALALSSLLPGINNDWGDHMGAIIFTEAIAGAVIALIIGAFRKLQMAVKEAEAKIHEREMRETQLSEAAAKAQSAALQSQINPHFFFNTLNTLAALIPTEAADAQEIVGRLADMFRYTLACSRAEAVTLDQELQFTENYLCIEQARFRERLQVTLPNQEFADIHLPGLSLQPLVENAIKYGVAPRVEGGSVEVAVHRNGVSCRVDVMSPKDGKVVFRPGHALENVRDRLRLFGGAKSGVDIAEDSPRTRVSLVLAK